MSVRVMGQVWELTLPDSQKLVLLALADCANDEGHAWPSIATIARKCCRGVRTVQGVMHDLEEAGHISRQQVIGRGCNYYIHPQTPAAAAPQQGTTPPQRAAQTPAAAAPKPSRTIIPKKERARATRVPADFLPLVKPDTITGKAMAAWPPGTLDEQIEHFIDHHTTHGTLSLEWQASWRTWVKNWKRFNARRPANDRHAHGSQSGHGRTIDATLDFVAGR